eukprot:TRINITY_DN1208_c2_g2_i1.p1 TRINITY_DN1208_c2_g2~~TRINITY_DN1208_c2_g2_i1.p1  ORF type:complete len:178 (-),score=20.22 TRINITY_DN1208_c2_g2_i1:53-586(-)
MKRSLTEDHDERPTIASADKMKKKIKCEENDEEEEPSVFQNIDEDLVFEILKHVDARSLATAACVSKQWQKTAQDERLWEMICTRHGANIGCGSQQLRSVVLAFGGFRQLYSLFLWPLLKRPRTPPNAFASSSSSSSLSSFVRSPKTPKHWGKDEVHLSLSLLSIRYFEKMIPQQKG